MGQDINLQFGVVFVHFFLKVREKRGLAYTTYSFSNAHSQTGLFGVYAGTTKRELKQLLPVLTDEIKKIRTQKVSEEELKRAKTQLKASMLMGLESSSASSEVLARQMLVFNRVLSIDEMVSRIEKITPEDILETAGRIFSSRPTYTLVGDIDGHADFDQLQQMLK